MDLEGIILVSQAEKNGYYMFLLICEILKSQLIETWQNDATIQESGWRRLGDVGQNVKISTYKMNKFFGSNVQHGDNN